jgi:hypothetical protein
VSRTEGIRAHFAEIGFPFAMAADGMHLRTGQVHARWSDTDGLLCELVVTLGHGHGVAHYLIDGDLIPKYGPAAGALQIIVAEGAQGIVRTTVSAIGQSGQQVVDELRLSPAMRRELRRLLEREPDPRRRRRARQTGLPSVHKKGS